MAYATSAILITMAVTAAVAAASTYMASQAQAAQEEVQAKAAKQQANYARAAAEVEAMDREAAAKATEQTAAAKRSQVQANARRFLNAQAAQAGYAGVIAGEGSLLANQLEAASLAEYDAQLAEYPDFVSAQQLRTGADRARFQGNLQGEIADYQSQLFRWKAGNTRTQGTIATGLSLASSAAGSYGKAFSGAGGYTPNNTGGGTSGGFGSSSRGASGGFGSSSRGASGGFGSSSRGASGGSSSHSGHGM